MSVKILGGLAKGQSLFVPKGDKVRPTSVMLRRRLFDANQHWHGVTFVDACAGCGAMGFEAWSRGASKVILVESDRQVFNTLKRNVTKLEEGNKAILSDMGSISCSNQPFEKWLDFFQSTYSAWNEEEQSECVIFFDPPYHLSALYKKVVIDNLREKGWFKGSVWIESDEKEGLKSSYWDEQGFKASKLVTQRDSYVYIVEF